VVFAGFPDTSQLQGTSTSLPAYFDSPQVQQQLEEDKEAQAGLVGRMSSLMDAVMSVQPLVRQFAESAKSAGSKLGSSSSSSTSTPLASRLAGDMGADTNSPRAGSPDDEEYAAAAAWEQQQQGGGLARQVQGSAAAGAAAAQAAAANLAAAFEQASGELQGRLGSKWPAVAAAAALAVAAAGVALTRGSGSDGALTPAPGQTAASVQRSAATSSSSAATPAAIKQLDKAQALKLVKRFQAAKAAALSSEFNTSQLGGVCVGNALQQFVSMSEDWASQGWFRTSSVWKAEIVKLELRSSSGQRVAVTARIGEKSSTWGIDGQQGNSWSNEYDVEYDVVLCSDLQWRIQGLQVRGKDQGAGGLFGIFGGGSGN
jgi:hypothetical protein